MMEKTELRKSGFRPIARIVEEAAFCVQQIS
mgnify:FL=1